MTIADDCWFVSYLVGGSTIAAGSGVVSNVALSGVHPLIWISDRRIRSTSPIFGMDAHLLYFTPIDAETFKETQQMNVVPAEIW